MKKRTGVLHDATNGNRMTFAYVNARNQLMAVIDDYDIQGAWVIATGWGDSDDIEAAKKRGNRLVPCIVEWEDE